MGYDDDEVGYYEIGDELVGDEAVEALLGAARPRRRAPRVSAAALAMAQRRANAGLLVKDKGFSKGRTWVLGFDSVTAVAVGATATITQRPQELFRGERLIIPSNVAVQFEIIDIRVGKDSQLLASGAIPGVTFSEAAVGVRLGLDTCKVGNDLTLTIRNTSTTTPARFTASMIGSSVA